MTTPAGKPNSEPPRKLSLLRGNSDDYRDEVNFEGITRQSTNAEAYDDAGLVRRWQRPVINLVSATIRIPTLSMRWKRRELTEVSTLGLITRKECSKKRGSGRWECQDKIHNNQLDVGLSYNCLRRRPFSIDSRVKKWEELCYKLVLTPVGVKGFLFLYGNKKNFWFL